MRLPAFRFPFVLFVRGLQSVIWMKTGSTAGQV
jgi:hypothetical protein